MARGSSSDTLPNLAEHLSRIQGCTKSALAAILHRLQQRGDLSSVDVAQSAAPETIRKRMREPYRNLRAIETPHGPLLKRIETGVDSEPEIEIVNPMAYLYHLSTICPSFAELMQEVSEGGNRLLRIVLYIDSVNPGNPLRQDKGRTTECVYWVLVDLPDHLLSKSFAWFICSVARTTLVEEMPGQFSGWMRKTILELWSQEGPNFEKGVCLPMGQRDVLARCELAGILADEKALREVFGYRGASGSKPCPTCANLVQFVEDHLLVNTRFVNLQTIDDRLLGYQSNEDVYNIVDQLHAAVGHVTVATFDRMQQISGINYLPDGMLADRYLRSIVKPIDHYLRDAMHTLTSGGVAGTEMSLLLQSLEAIGISPEHLQRWASAFSLPKAQGKPPATVFSSDRVGGTQMRCFASEILTLSPILLAFFEESEQAAALLPRHHRCWELMVRILYICSIGPRRGASLTRTLRESIIEHHTIYRELYTQDGAVKPKWHHMLHLPEDIDRIGALLTCFVTERKHRSVKRHGLWTFRNYEHTLIADVLNSDIGHHMEANAYSAMFLISPIDHLGLLMSSAVRLPCGEIRKNDIVACRGGVVVEAICFWSSSKTYRNIVMQAISLIATENRRSLNRTEDITFVHAEDIVEAVAWTMLDGSVRPILPPRGLDFF